MIRIALALLAALVVAAPAHAGLGDPPPAPFTKHVFSVPGVINDGVVTIISCTNALLTPLNVGVEWFKADGTSIGVNSVSVAAGRTVNFATADTGGAAHSPGATDGRWGRAHTQERFGSRAFDHAQRGSMQCFRIRPAPARDAAAHHWAEEAEGPVARASFGQRTGAVRQNTI